MFSRVAAYAGDPIFAVLDAFLQDERANKVNLGIGLYYDENGQVPLLDCVREAEARLAEQGTPRVYLPVAGLTTYCQAVQQQVFGEAHPALRAQRVATIQTVGSSGALRIGAEFLHSCFPNAQVWLSDPSWESHRLIFEAAGWVVNSYPYFDHSSGGGLLLEPMLATLAQLPAQSVVLLHPCCHNPTGVDLDRAAWQRLIDILAKNRLIPFLDMAYQGFGEGIEEDAWTVRTIAEVGIDSLVTNSFSKNLSVYGERCGSLSVVCADQAQAQQVFGQLQLAVRRSYSSPPDHGAQIVAIILQDSQLRQQWHDELERMRQRIRGMRQRLHDRICALRPEYEPAYLLAQQGMFSYTGLREDQVERLSQQFAVYLLRSGRMCVTGLNSHNVEHVAESFAEVLGMPAEVGG